jgi:hypothetical protein
MNQEALMSEMIPPAETARIPRPDEPAAELDRAI